MKSLLRLLIVLTILVPSVAFAKTQSLSKTIVSIPTPGPLAPRPITIPGTLINDGSFELGTPPASAWTEYSSTGCEWIMDVSSAWGISAFSGSYAFWAGGYCGDINSNYVEQSITLPAHASKLYFMICAYRPDADDVDADTFVASINGTPVYTLNMVQANDTYPNWAEKSVDISGYAGQTVTLRFAANNAGNGIGNVLVDSIRVEEGVPASIPTLSEWGMILFAGMLAWLAIRKLHPAAV